MEIRVYVANLGAYNRGCLVGEWLTLPMDEDDLKEELDEILNGEEAQKTRDEDDQDEEWAIHDYEGPFKIDEFDNIFQLNECAEVLDSADEDEVQAISEMYEDIKDVVKIIEDGNYQFYPGADLEDLAEQFVDEGLFGSIEGPLANYIDYEALGRDLGHDGYTEVSNGVLYFC